MKWLCALPMFVIVFAGCLGTSDSEADSSSADGATLLCRDGICNYQATVDPITRQANELSIAVNPKNPLNIVASGKDYTPNEAGDCVRDGIYVTFDGGSTWENSNVPGSPWRLAGSQPDAFSPDADLSKYWCVTDPVVAFAPDGTLYWTVMPYQCDAATGSKTGEGIHPDGGFNDWFWSCSSMYVLVSDDGGATFPIIREVAFGPRLEHDKQWISVAPDGTVLLCWDRDPSYQATAFAPGGNPATQLTQPGYMVCSTSIDQGRSWSDVTDVNPPADPVTGAAGTWDGFLPWIDWDARNHAWMVFVDAAGNVGISHSPDGLDWDEPTIIGNYTNPPANGAYGWPALSGSIFRTFALPALAVDRSGGSNDGNMVATWMDHAGSAGVVLFSTFDGVQWTEAMPVNATVNDQFMPAVSAGPDGTFDMVWYDRRDDADNHLFDLYYAYSVDGGLTWSDALRVSEQSSDEQYSHHQNGMVFMGDYIDIDSDRGHAYPVWVDTRNSKADAFVAIIERPGANPA